MSEDIRVTNPVSIQSEAKSRVVFDLMELIAAHESESERKDRTYWLTLYTQCYKATSGNSLKSVLSTAE